jgi:hypothetical protein
MREKKKRTLVVVFDEDDEEKKTKFIYCLHVLNGSCPHYIDFLFF